MIISQPISHASKLKKFPNQLHCYCLHMSLEDCPLLDITLTFRRYFLTALSPIDRLSNSSLVATFTAIGTLDPGVCFISAFYDSIL